MAFISDTQLARLQSQAVRVKARAEEKAGEIKDGMEIIGAATLMGYLRGYWEKDGEPFVIPKTDIDIELLVGIGLVGLGLSDMLGKYDNDALMTGYGCLAHYGGQLARNFGKRAEGAEMNWAAGVGGVGGLDDILAAGI